MNAPPPGRPKKILGEEDRRVREKWRDRIKEEKEQIRKEQEQHVRPVNLTDEQRRIRNVISARTCAHRDRVYRETTGESSKQKVSVPGQKGEEANKSEVDSGSLVKAPRGRKPNRVLTAEEQQAWESWEQRVEEEGEAMRREREQQVLLTNLTKEQKKLQRTIWQRNKRSRDRREKLQPS
ncbi:hypothetical protein MMC22_004566 [Lobaria immixta]|nr:hypothetical protein [Lobaria immixta]